MDVKMFVATVLHNKRSCPPLLRRNHDNTPPRDLDVQMRETSYNLSLIKGEVSALEAHLDL